MKLQMLFEMAKPAATCSKCGRGPMSKTHYWYKGEWKCKSGAASSPPNPAATAPSPVAPSPAAQPVSPPAPISQAPAATRPVTPPPASPVAPVSPTRRTPPPGLMREYLDQYLKKMKISNYTINDDLSVDVDGDVSISGQLFKKIPCKFGQVTGSFSWIGGQLTVADNLPDRVDGDLDISHNEIASITKLPEITGSIRLNGNLIASWEGVLPDSVEGDLHIQDNPATDIVGNLPTIVHGDLAIGSTEPYSLRGIHKNVRRVDDNVVVYGPVSEGGLGLLMIKNLQGIDVANNTKSEYAEQNKAFAAIEKARVENKDVLDLQEELIDAGMSKFAKL
jgi:hypothetical protein